MKSGNHMSIVTCPLSHATCHMPLSPLAGSQQYLYAFSVCWFIGGQFAQTTLAKCVWHPTGYSWVPTLNNILPFSWNFLSVTRDLFQLSRLTNDSCIKNGTKTKKEVEEEETMQATISPQSTILNESLM